MTRRRNVTVSAILLGLILASGCGKDKPGPVPDPEKKPEPVAKKPEKEKEKDKGKDPVVEAPKAIQVTAAGLTEEFLNNQTKAEQKYKGKVIEVEGKVELATQNSIQKTGSVTLSHRPKPAPGSDVSLALSVKCEVKPALAGKVGMIAKGQKIMVKGDFARAEAGNVTLKNCEYDARSVAHTPSVTAEVITKAFAEDKSAAEKKYLEKDVIVSGSIIDLVAKDGSFTVKLAGDGKFRVSCNLDYEDEFKTLKKGDKVRIKGEVAFLDGPELVVTTAFLVHKE